MKSDPDCNAELNDYWSHRRAVLRERFSGMGFRECPLCGCPIRQPLFQDPRTGELGSMTTGTTVVITKRVGEEGEVEIEIEVRVEVELRMMCEVCWQENSGQEGDSWSGMSRFGGQGLGKLVDVWV